MPAYVCPAVPGVVTSLGLDPIFADVGDDLNTSAIELDSKICGETLAVIVPHMYGCPAGIADIETLCSKRDVFLIDDAAQVVGERVENRTLGTFGDLGIWSFAQSKAVVCGPTGSGGAILVNNASMAGAIANQVGRLPVAENRFAGKVSFALSVMVEQLGPEFAYYWARVGRAMRSSRRTHCAVEFARISDVDAAIASRQFERLGDIVAERTRIAGLYGRSIDRLGGCTFVQYGPDRFLSRIMLVTPFGISASNIRDRLRRAGCGSRGGYPVYGDPTGVPKAALLRNRLFEAPSYPGMGIDDVDRFCRLLAGVCDAERVCRATDPTIATREVAQ